MPGAVTAVRLAGALALLILGCGTGVISAPGGGVAPPGSTNHSPVVTVAPSATTSPLVEGRGTQLSVTADDPDGDSLGYAWTQISPASPCFTSRSSSSRILTSQAATGKPQDRNSSGVFGSWSALRSTDTG